MKPSFNLNILKHTSVSGSAINNLMTLIHLVEAEGNYNGTILQNERLFSGFTVQCNKEAKNDLLHIDLSLFDQLHAQSIKQMHYKHPLFHIKPGGVLLFYVSGKHKGFSIKIEGLKNKNEPEFNSSHLNNKDKAAIRLFHFGKYELTDTLKKKKMSVEVVKKSDGTFSKTGSVPAIINHSDKGFEKGSLTVHAGQILVINSSGDIAIDVKKIQKK